MASSSFKTAKEAQLALAAQGYKHLFEVVDSNVLRSEDGVAHPSDEFELDGVHLVEEEENRLTSVYALSTRNGRRGVVLDGFGVTGSVHRTNFLKYLTSKHTIKD